MPSPEYPWRAQALRWRHAIQKSHRKWLYERRYRSNWRHTWRRPEVPCAPLWHPLLTDRERSIMEGKIWCKIIWGKDTQSTLTRHVSTSTGWNDDLCFAITVRPDLFTPKISQHIKHFSNIYTKYCEGKSSILSRVQTFPTIKIVKSVKKSYGSYFGSEEVKRSGHYTCTYLVVRKEVVCNLYENSRPVDRIDTAHIVLFHKICVFKHFTNGDIKLIRSSINWKTKWRLKNTCFRM